MTARLVLPVACVLFAATAQAADDKRDARKNDAAMAISTLVVNGACRAHGVEVVLIDETANQFAMGFSDHHEILARRWNKKPAFVRMQKSTAVKDTVRTAPLLWCAIDRQPRALVYDAFSGERDALLRLADHSCRSCWGGLESPCCRSLKESVLEERAALPDRGAHWNYYRLVYPYVSMIIELSAVGLNDALDEAFIYVAVNAPGSCAEGRVYRFVRKNGFWSIDDSVRVWIA